MNILVCISVSPDTTAKIDFTNNNTEFNTSGIQFIINPYDEIAMSRAMELKEATGGTLHVINVGEAEAEPNIRKALALGADEAIRINAKPTDALFVSKQIANYAKENAYDIILTGYETINYNGAQVASILGELLSIPSISGATKLAIDGSIATISKEIDGGQEELTSPLPCVVSAQEGMAEPRIPNMRGIMSARTKPLKVVEPTGDAPVTSHVNYELPPQKEGCKYVEADNVPELVDLLHNEAKVI